jgi:hypothetical protein
MSSLSLVIISTKHLAIRSRDTLAMLPRLSGSPLLGLASNTDFVVQLINLLEGQTLGLVDEEVYESNAQETATEPDEEDLGLEIGLSGTEIDEVGSRISYNVLVTWRWKIVGARNIPIAQLKSQLVAVVILRDLARVLRGKISPVTTQARGPQVEAKKKM